MQEQMIPAAGSLQLPPCPLLHLAFKNALLRAFEGFRVWGAWATNLFAQSYNKLFSAPNSNVSVLFGLTMCWIHKPAFGYIFISTSIHVPMFSSVQFISVAQSCQTLCDPMNRSTPGIPVHHKLPEFTQTHAHRVGDSIQPSPPLLSPSPPAPNPSQH